MSKNENKKHDSFYKNNTNENSSIKSIKIDWNKTPKFLFKIFKWSLFLFLTITTLWGCVQEFTISSSQFLSQGLETYQNSEKVLPNLFYTNKDFSYVSKENEEDSSTLSGFDNVLFPIYKKFDDGTIDRTTVTWQNVTEVTNLLALDDGWYSVDLSTGYSTSLYSLSTWNYYVLFDTNVFNQQLESKGQIYLPYYYSNSEDITLNNWYTFDETETEPLSQTVIDKTFSFSNFDLTLYDEATKTALYNIEKLIGITNFYGYMSSTSISSSDLKFKDSTEAEASAQKLIDDNFLIINENSSVNQSLIDYYKKYTTIDNFTGYKTVDYGLLFTDSGELSAGVNIFALQQQKNNNMQPSFKTYDYLYNQGGINEIRSPNWESAPTAGSGYTYEKQDDETISNAGWLFMDNQGERLIFTDSTNNSQESLQAQTLDNNLGDPNAESSSIYEKNNKLINGDYKIDFFNKNDFNIFLGDSKYTLSEINNSFNYIGFSTIETKSNSSIKNNSNIITTPNKSITSTGQKEYNQNRIALSSWGEAWTYGPFYGLFVYPISIIAVWLSILIPYTSIGGWSVIISVFIIVFLFRGLATLMSLKSTKNSQKMQEVQLKVAQINAKYEMYKDNKNMKQRKQMEIMALYKKEGVKPLSSIGSMFLTLPIFLAMWTIISALPLYKIASFGPLLLSVSPFYGIFNLLFKTAGIYLLIGVTVGFIQFMSYKLPTWLAQKRQGVKNLDDATKAQMKKSSKVMNIMMFVFMFIGLTIPTLLSLYWIFSSLFTITQTLIQHHFKEKAAKNHNK